ncbi:2-aminoethylphosphonate--pyruvate transaminase-like [Ruditapes philippinarum]|uniref:2-aminoethylphosphonate--pyruvate transaminase-like n=1 Tax=Ruditapes philippinarum TaxID=129788 RepID=UPI00295C1C33|nr:2-aminoethylphosphonate--pyruvate transaminase-like [Ruditapes philippinarum]
MALRMSIRKLAHSYGIRDIRPLCSVNATEILQSRQIFLSPRKMSDKKLFTPGPLGTSPTVKSAMLRDLGSRDVEFIKLIKTIRSKLVQIAGVSDSTFTAVPMQGSGTFAIESVFQTATKRSGAKVLVFENGAYGKRLGKVCEVMGVEVDVISFPENDYIDLKKVESILQGNNSYTLVAMVHCETSSGVINPVEGVGKIVKQHLPDSDFFVDAMSSFGAIPLDLEAAKVDYLVSSVNKCLEGVPGFSYAIARLNKLLGCKGNSRSISLDLFEQYDNLEKTNQFRFTPPTHTMLAFAQAIQEFETEGGVEGRSARYRENCTILKAGMKEMGFKEFLSPNHEGYIITSYCFPQDKNFNFNNFYMKLNERDQVIYPGKVLDADCFRIGSIGYLFPNDVRHLLKCIKDVCKEMNITLPIKE